MHEERLFPLNPVIRSMKPGRDLLVSEEIRAVANPPWNSVEEKRHARMRGQLDRFTLGRGVTMAMEPFKKDAEAFFAPIAPTRDDVWDIRCIEAEASIRVFGCFARKDCFVALTFRYREDLPNCDDWDAERERCKYEWKRLFEPYPPFRGATVHEYISRKVRAV